MENTFQKRKQFKNFMNNPCYVKLKITEDLHAVCMWLYNIQNTGKFNGIGYLNTLKCFTFGIVYHCNIPLKAASRLFTLSMLTSTNSDLPPSVATIEAPFSLSQDPIYTILQLNHANESTARILRLKCA